MKDRCAALQCQLERMREQLVAAEGDNTSFRADLAGLLGARQEVNAAREKLRQVQLDSSRRITELEADAADMSQQIMVSDRMADCWWSACVGVDSASCCYVAAASRYERLCRHW
jgi:chromosome segregation ATPase